MTLIPIVEEENWNESKRNAAVFMYSKWELNQGRKQ